MIKNPYQVVIITVFLAIAGFALIPKLNVQYLASGDKHSLRVQYSAYGYSSEVLEREVCVPIESAIATMRGISQIKSTTRQGYGYVDIELSRFVDLDFFRFELSAKLRQLYSRFPPEVSYPTVTTISGKRGQQEESDQPILVYTVSAPRSVDFIEKYANEVLAPALGSIEGISHVEIHGSRDRQIQMDIDPLQLDYYDVSFSQIQNVLHQGFYKESIGFYRKNENIIPVTISTSMDTSSDTHNLNSLQNLLVLSGGQQRIPLFELAHFYWKEEEVSKYYRINGQNALRILIFPDIGVNHLQASHHAKQEILTLQQEISNGIRLTLERDNTLFLQKELKKIYQRTGLSLLILMIFVLLCYWSWQPISVIFSSIIVNLGISFIFYYFCKVELNLYALAGITVTFGMIIDNAIVMMQHLRSHGNRQVFAALLTATLTTLSALIILFFLPDHLKVELRYFAIVIIINLSVSLFISLIYVPAFIELLNNGEDKIKVARGQVLYQKWEDFYRLYIGFVQRRRYWMIGFLILLFGIPIFKLPAHWEGHDWYNQTIGSQWYQDEARPIVNKILGGSLRLFVYSAYEHGGLREQEETQLYIRCKMPEGSSLEQTNELIIILEQYLDHYADQLKSYTTTISDGQNANIVILFDDHANPSLPYILKDRSMLFSNQFGGAQWNIYGVGKGYSNANMSNPPSFSIEFTGYDREKMAQYAEAVKSKLENHPRVRDVKTNTTLSWFGGLSNEYFLDIDMDKTYSQGLDLSTIAQVMKYYNLKNEVMIQPLNHARIDYGLRLNHADRWSLENRTISHRGRPISLGSALTFSREKTAQDIIKINQEYVQGIKFNYTGSHRFGQKYLEEVLAEMKLELPLGFRMATREFSYFSTELQQKQYKYLLLIIVLIYIIMAIHFESLRLPLVIITIIPLSYIGIFLIFYWTGSSFDQGGYTSFILVTGLTVNGLIYLLSDYYKLLKSVAVVDKLEAYLQAFRYKILPIFLTLISTSVGLLPFALIGQGDVFWHSLAVGSIGGILFSFIVIVCFVPLFLVSGQVHNRNKTDQI
ncbi:efflux RND transporter permease subunit [Membranihabitans marinus]|uniref:efflux RND transporter permease subunit n=1 Tax=Membranihabitans marinus TaxID=1227546 RepID=UPI00293F3278|nr:efflux RND transporter permease subunit [Membranihabitans marinus]